MAKTAKNTAESGAKAAQAPQRKTSWLWFLALLLAGAFVSVGLVGHGPWTDQEAYSLAAVESILDSGDYLVPTVDGDPALATPPLYYMASAGLAQAVAEYLPAAQGARIATGVFLAITLLFTALFARAAWRPGDQPAPDGVGAAAVLLLISTIGVVWYGHDMSADSALMAGMAMGLYGLALLPRKVLLGGLWLGTGAGVAFMAKGIFAPFVLLAAVLVLMVIGIARLGRYLRGILVAVLFALPWLLIWPLLLQQRDPALYQAFLATNALDSYLSSFSLGTPEQQLQWLWLFLVMAFPAWLIAIITLVVRPGALFGFAGVRAALAVTLLGWAAVITSGAFDLIYGLALLVPLAVLAAGGVQRLPRWFVWPLHWVSAVLFGAIAIALWGAWIWLLYQGAPPPVEPLGQYLPMDYGFNWQPAIYVTAAVVTVIWFWALMRYRPSRPAALLVWPVGVVMVWSLLALHQPWIDAAIADGTLAKTVPAALVPDAASNTAPDTEVDATPDQDSAGDADAGSPMAM
jgi:4-amino-4-deoxy-L-arabinose transferase-like glycosyltransferase